MANNRAQPIVRAKELLNTIWFAAMATVNEDGTPHNTPLVLLYAADLSRIYWGSHPDSLHSRNAIRTGQVFWVLYDAIKTGGVYIKATDAHALAGDELEAALKVHNKARAARGKDALTLDYYSGDSPQRMWSATPTAFWVNDQKRNEQGHVIEDYRQEVSAQELLESDRHA